MCHHCHVPLSAEDEKEVRKLSGILIPVYASIMFAIIGLIAIVGVVPQGEIVATASIPATSR